MADPSAVAASPDPSATLDLGSVEADLADPGVVGLRKLGTVGTGPLCRIVASVPALVAEVRRLRERLDEERRGAERLSQWYNAAQAECDAARAEAEEPRKADRPPNVDRMALGANRLNDYEIGYLDSGMGDVPQRWPEGWAIPDVTRDA